MPLVTAIHLSEYSVSSSFHQELRVPNKQSLTVLRGGVAFLFLCPTCRSVEMLVLIVSHALF